MFFSLQKDASVTVNNKRWQFCIGSCHAPLAHRVDYLEQLKFIRDELGIERVRFHGLFNDDMQVGMSLKNLLPLKGAKNYREFSFYQIARVYDNLLSIGVKPFVELSFMPKILASGKRKCSFSYKGNITMPKSLEEWSAFIAEFIGFLVERYGREEVEGWYFEVWNEPNLPVFFKGSQTDYFKLYETTARAIKGVDDKIKVGGPSTAACAWISEFTGFCKRNNVPCDFISTHQYPGEALGHSFSVGAMAKTYINRYKTLKKVGGGTVLEGARIMFEDTSAIEGWDRDLFRKNAEKLREIIGEMPLLYTEWNVTATCTAPINDTRRAASYIVRTAMETDTVSDGISFWCFSDIFEELQFFPQPFSGSFGLLNIYGVPKPSFYALKLLSMLGDERFEGGQTGGKVELTAFKKGDTKQFLIYNQSFKIEGDPENVCVEVFGASPKEVRVFRIDENHCNPLAVWEKMGSPKYLNPIDVEHIKKQSALSAEAIPFEYKDGKTLIKTVVGQNDVQLIEVIY